MRIYLTKRSMKRLERMLKWPKFNFQTKSKSKQKPKAILNSKNQPINQPIHQSMVVFKVTSYGLSRFCSQKNATKCIGNKYPWQKTLWYRKQSGSKYEVAANEVVFLSKANLNLWKIILQCIK